MTDELKKSLAVVAVVSLACAAPFWLPQSLPSTDGPAHMYIAHVLHEMSRNGVKYYADYFQANWGLSTNLVVYWAAYALLEFFDPATVEKIIASLLALCWPWVSFFALRGFSPHPVLATVLLVPLLLGKLFSMGFYNFFLALELAMVGLGLWLRLEQEFKRHLLLWLAAVSLVGMLAHVFPIANMLVVIASGMLYQLAFRRPLFAPTSPNGAISKTTSGLRRSLYYAIALLPAALLLIFFMLTSSAAEGGFNYGVAWYVRAIYLFVFGHVVAFGVIDFAICAILIFAAGIGLFEKWRAPDRAAQRNLPQFLLLITLFYACLFIAIPSTLPQGGLAHLRIGLIFYVMFFFWFFAREYRAHYIGLLKVLACVILIALPGLRGFQMIKLEALLLEFRDVSRSVHEGATILSVSNAPMAGGNLLYAPNFRAGASAMTHFSTRLAADNNLVDLKVIQAVRHQNKWDC